MSNTPLNDGMPAVWQGLDADRVLELVLIGTLTTGALGLLAALFGMFAAPQIWLLGLLLTVVYAARTRNRPLRQNVNMRWAHVGLLIIIALFFRLPAFNYVLGGQDEGVYVNIANHIEQTGGIAVSDDIATKLAGGPALQQYLASNRESLGGYVAGVYAPDAASPTLEFQFYHLFPVWMALVSGVLGTSAGVYALTLFSLLSILFAYRLVLTLTAQPRAALIAGMLLALNPLHVFFSKFPVTEVPTLALSLAGFSYLAGYWLAAPDARRTRVLALSFAAFATLFLVRISGFMYIPFFIALACLSAICDGDQRRRWAIQGFVLVVTLAYALSVVYGLVWSHSYASDIYELALGGVLGDAWGRSVAIAGVLAALLWTGCLWLLRRPVWRERVNSALLSPLRSLLGLVVIAGVAIAVLKIHWLGWTQHYSTDAMLSGWGLAGSGWRAAKASSFAQLGVYLGPLLLFCGLVLLCGKRRDPAVEFLRLFTAGFVVYALALQWVVPYGPYYARYLLSEALPYLTLFVVCVWAAMSAGHARRLLGAILALSIGYAGVLSAGQLGKQENGGLYATLSELVSHVDKGDVILLDSMDAGVPDTSELKTPLLYTFGKQVITVSNADLADAAYLAALGQQFDDMYLISPTSHPPQGFKQTDSVRMNVWSFRWGHGPPLKMDLRESVRLHLFQRGRPQLPVGVVQNFNSGAIWNDWLHAGWSDPEPWGVWAVGKEATLIISIDDLPKSDGGLRLRFQMRAYVLSKHPSQHAEIDVDGIPALKVAANYPDPQLAFDLPVSEDRLRAGGKLKVHFVLPDAVSPQSLGEGADARLLSLALLSVQADPLPVAPVSKPPAAIDPAIQRRGSRDVKEHAIP